MVKKTEVSENSNNKKYFCALYDAETNKFAKTSFLASNINYSYKTIACRNSLKIINLSKTDNQERLDDLVKEFKVINRYEINKNIMSHILNQFERERDHVIRSIALFYNYLHEAFNVDDSDYLFLSIGTKSKESMDKLYNYCNGQFPRYSIEEIIQLIKQYGYSYTVGDTLYWKTYNPKQNLSEEIIAQAFTCMSSDINEQEPQEIIDTPSKEVPEEVINSLDILNKYIGVTLKECSNEDIKTLVSKTDDLINDFDNMKDWEKLMNWKNFISDWNKLSKEALDDRT